MKKILFEKNTSLWIIGRLDFFFICPFIITASVNHALKHYSYIKCQGFLHSSIPKLKCFQMNMTKKNYCFVFFFAQQGVPFLCQSNFLGLRVRDVHCFSSCTVQSCSIYCRYGWPFIIIAKLDNLVTQPLWSKYKLSTQWIELLPQPYKTTPFFSMVELTAIFDHEKRREGGEKIE